VDLIEEIARRHGYDEFPDDLRAYRPSSVPTHPLFLLEDRVRALLVGRGMLEARTAAFVPEADGDVELLLPLAATESRLRRSLVTGLLRRVEYNHARGARSVRLFEIGTTFAAPADDGVPVETTRIAVACTGHRQPPHWSQGDATFDVWDMKALADDVAAALGHAVHEGSDAPHLDPALSFRLVGPHDQAVTGSAGRVRSGIVDAPVWAGDVWVLEVELPLDGARAAPVRFAELPQHPGIERDLALLISAQQSAAQVGDAIRQAGGALLVSAEPFDLYSGRGVPEHMRSIGWRLRFRAPDRTLTDAEVDAAIRVVLVRLNDDLGVKQRA
jgi:phenylalanyl-tRNA synthetase beta chain